MKLGILAFGIAKEIVGASSVEIDIPEDISIKDLRFLLEKKYARLTGLPYQMALNTEFASDLATIKQSDEIAIIPPVSGG